MPRIARRPLGSVRGTRATPSADRARSGSAAAMISRAPPPLIPAPSNPPPSAPRLPEDLESVSLRRAARRASAQRAACWPARSRPHARRRRYPHAPRTRMTRRKRRMRRRPRAWWAACAGRRAGAGARPTARRRMPAQTRKSRGPQTILQRKRLAGQGFSRGISPYRGRSAARRAASRAVSPSPAWLSSTAAFGRSDHPVE